MRVTLEREREERKRTDYYWAARIAELAQVAGALEHDWELSQEGNLCFKCSLEIGVDCLCWHDAVCQRCHCPENEQEHEYHPTYWPYESEDDRKPNEKSCIVCGRAPDGHDEAIRDILKMGETDV